MAEASSRRSWKSLVLWWLAYTVLIFVPFIVEHATDTNELSCSQFSRTSRSFYRFLSAPGYRKPRAHYVHLVTIQDEVDPSAAVTDNCTRRRYLTKLLPALALQDPAVIVLDFSPNTAGSCPAEVDTALSDALQQVARKVPVVVGEWAKSSGERSKEEQSSLSSQHFGENDLLLIDPRWIRGKAAGQQVTYGVTTILCDNRAVPLSWYVFSPTGTNGAYTREQVASLSAATIRAYEESDKPAALQAGLAHQNPPLISFLEGSAFGHTDAIDLICPGRKDAANWESCLPTEGAPTHIRSRVALVGLGSNPMRSDYHASILGEVPAYLLQANYIEALLDDRLLWQVSPWLQLALSAILVGLIHLVFVFFSRFFSKDESVKAHIAAQTIALIASLMLVVIVFLVCRLLALVGGWYLDFWISGLLVTPVVFVEHLREKLSAK
jgi:CHASE2 domain-containing sensor protein